MTIGLKIGLKMFLNLHSGTVFYGPKCLKRAEKILVEYLYALYSLVREYGLHTL